MSKQTYGGDDEEAPSEETKRPKLSKFELAPDTNIRDLFWKIMASYAATKGPGMELSELYSQRFALEKASVAIMEGERSNLYGMSPRFVAQYTLMMFLDAGWEDAFLQFISDIKESKGDGWKAIVRALQNMLLSENYRALIRKYFQKAIRNQNTYQDVLFYLPRIKDAALIAEFKRELIIYARGDADEGQENAMKSLALLEGDEDAKEVILNLLKHWDADVRRKAATLIKDMKIDESGMEFIEKRAEAETNDEIKRMLMRKVSLWKRKKK